VPIAGKFQVSPLSNVWKTVIRYMRNQPQCAPFKTWFVWSGDPARDVREIDYNDLPAVKVSPGDGAGQWLDEQAQELTLYYLFDIAVGTTDVTHLFDAWYAIHTSLFTGNTLLGQLEAYQVIQKTSTGVAHKPVAYSGGTGLTARASMRIKMRINS
jgi:hypothetical protein